MIYLRLRAAVRNVCFTIVLIFVMMLCWQYLFLALWNGSEDQTAGQLPDVSDGGDGIKTEGQLLKGLTLNTESSHEIEDIPKTPDDISHQIESPSASGKIKFPSDVAETKPADTSLMGKRNGRGKGGTKPEEGKVPKLEVRKAGKLPNRLDQDDENKKLVSKKTETDHDSNLTTSSTPAIHKPQPGTSTTVNVEGSIHSHAEQNQGLKPHLSAMPDGDASSSAQGPEPETKSGRTSAEVKQPSKLENNKSAKGIKPETNDSTGHKSSDRSRPSTSEENNSTSGNEPETNASEREFSNRPRAIILWSYWRSGSTFLADLLANTSPNVTFYSFEPLYRYGKRVLTKKHKPETQEAVGFLKDLLNCDLRAHKDYVVDNSKLSFMVYANPYLWRRCAKEDKCGDVETFSKTCLSASLHIAKITRLSALYAKAFLETFEDLQIVYLLRDPRAIMWSRLGNGQRGHSWCGAPTNPSGNPDNDKVCSDPHTVCRLLAKDIKTSKALWANHKTRFFALRYEDMSFRPKVTVNILWEALKLPVTETFLRYLDQATTGHKPKHQQTASSRHSRDHTFRWRTEATWDLIQEVQKECSSVIQQLGFKMYESEEELRNMTISPSVGPDFELDDPPR